MRAGRASCTLRCTQRIGRWRRDRRPGAREAARRLGRAGRLLRGPDESGALTHRIIAARAHDLEQHAPGDALATLAAELEDLVRVLLDPFEDVLSEERAGAVQAHAQVLLADSEPRRGLDGVESLDVAKDERDAIRA